MSRKRPPKPPVSAPTPGAAGMKEGGAASAAAPAAPKASWTSRSARFVLRLMGVLLFLGYLGMTSTSSLNWFKIKWVRAQPLSNVTKVADEYLNMEDRKDRINKPAKVYEWVSLRPERETPEIIRLLEPYTARLSTLQFLLYSARLQHLGHNDESLFYWQFTRYRARYDALRCGSVKAVDNLSALINFFPHPDFPDAGSENSDDVIKSIENVLAFDAKYPALNNPDDTCDILRSLEGGNFRTVPRERWADIRFSLRMLTEYRLQEMKKAEAAPAPKEPVTPKKSPAKKPARKTGGAGK